MNDPRDPLALASPPYAPHRATPAELKERLTAERRGRPFLLYRDGGDAQRILDLDRAPERLTLGRSRTNGLVLDWDAEVSRVHATLERLGQEWTLVDDGRSRNGTYVGGERIHGRTRLNDGDVIGLGRTVIVFRSPMGNETMLTAPSALRAPPQISEAQRRVLVALCRPYGQREFAVPASNRQIADELVIGLETVKTHMRALFDAFGLGDLPQHQKRAALAQRALELGLVTPRDL
jgi:pSer/pThr/pTyr-binding forkhead associated (FHA) protein